MRALTGAALVVVALTACSGSGGTSGRSGYGSDSDTTSSSSPSASEESSASGTDLAVADSSLGTIVVDATGMTVYVFDTDTQGADTSACSGQCATNWPAVETTAGTPSVEGVTAEVGTITGTDGGTQLTIDGWPVYTYAGDSAPGDVNGQGVGGIWWAISPSGERIATTG